MQLTTVTFADQGANFFIEGTQIMISGTTGLDMPTWITRWPWQDGDRMMFKWLCWILFGSTFNLDGTFTIKRIANRCMLELRSA